MGKYLDSTIIVVNEEPYCIWEVDLKGRNNEFLKGIDIDYFDYIVSVHLEAEDKKRASIALRATFHHALETMFSLLCAYIQAPDCVYAWISKCSNTDLRSILRKINKRDRVLFSKLALKTISWESVAELIFQWYMPGTEKNTSTSKLFAQFWHRLANEYLDENYILEYNSLKHGFRVKSGGFALAVGKEHKYGVPPPANEMKSIGQSKYGTTFFKLEPVGETKGNRSLRSRRISLNWKIEKVTLLIQLISMSITNVSSALQIVNGANPGEKRFVRPSKDSDFDKPWQFSPGVTNCSMDFIIRPDQVVPVTKKELLEKLKKYGKS